MRRRRLAISGGLVALVAVGWLGGSRLVVFEVGGRLVLDRVVIDRSPYLELPMRPRWRLTGSDDWYSVPASSLEVGGGGIAPGDAEGAVHVFGQFPAALADRVSQVGLETPPGEVRIEAIVVGERGFPHGGCRIAVRGKRRAPRCGRAPLRDDRAEACRRLTLRGGVGSVNGLFRT